MKTILLLSLAILAGCDVTQVPEEHRPAVDSLVRSDSARKADSIAALPKPIEHAFQICIAGQDKIQFQEWEDPSFWGEVKIRFGADTVKTGKLGSGQCFQLGTALDSTHLQVMSTTTATMFDSVWVQVDALPDRFFLPWRPVQLHPDSLRRISDSAWSNGIRGLVRRGNFR